MKSVICGLLLMPGLAFAAQWVQVSESDKVKHYIDLDTVAKVNGLTKAWFKLQYAAPKAERNYKIDNERQLWYFDCRGRRSVITQWTGYGTSGEVVANGSSPLGSMEMSDVTPETLGEDMITSACLVSSRIKE